MLRKINFPDPFVRYILNRLVCLFLTYVVRFFLPVIICSTQHIYIYIYIYYATPFVHTPASPYLLGHNLPTHESLRISSGLLDPICIYN